MTGTKQMYAYYIESLDNNIKEHKADIETSRAELLKSIEELKEVSPLLLQVTNFSFADIIKLPIEKYSKILVEKGQYYNIVKTRIKAVKAIKVKIRKLKASIKVFQQQYVEYEYYKQIIKAYNTTIVDLIIEKGITIGGAHGVGSFKVKRKQNKKFQRVDWKASNERKAEIIAKGGIPQHKDKAPDGEPWLIKYTKDYDCWFVWSARASNIKDIKRFVFKPTRTNIVKLQSFIKQDPLNEMIYD